MLEAGQSRWTVDGWSNALTGVGTTRDRAVNYHFCLPDLVTPEEAENLFVGDDLARLICSARVVDAFRPGFTLSRVPEIKDGAETSDADPNAKPGEEDEPAKPPAEARTDAPPPQANQGPSPAPAAKPAGKPAFGGPPGPDGPPAPPPPAPPVKPAVSPVEVQEQVRAIMRRWDELKLASRMREAAIWGQVYGWSGLYLSLPGSPTSGLPRPGDDEDDTAPTSPGRLKHVTVLTARDVIAEKRYQDALSPDFGMPETWKVQRHGRRVAAPTATEVHETRILAFPGILTPPGIRDLLQDRDLSALQPCMDVLRQTNGTWNSVQSMLQDLSQVVVKMKGLIQAVAAGKQQLIADRVALMDTTRSSSRSVVLDADGESLDVVERGAMAGLGDALSFTFLRLSAAARMPISRLLGQAPAGLASTGEGDRVWWYDEVRDYQQEVLLPRFQQLVQMVSLELFPDVDPRTWVVAIGDLEVPTPKETSELRASVANTDKIYIDTGVLTPSEVAIMRFGSGKWSAEYAIDLEVRERALEEELGKLVAPPPPALPPGQDPDHPDGPKGTPAKPPADASAQGVPSPAPAPNKAANPAKE